MFYMKYAHGSVIGKPEGKRLRRTISKLMLRDQDVRMCTGFSWLRIGSSGGLL
jgi:hypothetical protein